MLKKLIGQHIQFVLLVGCVSFAYSFDDFEWSYPRKIIQKERVASVFVSPVSKTQNPEYMQKIDFLEKKRQELDKKLTECGCTDMINNIKAQDPVTKNLLPHVLMSRHFEAQKLHIADTQEIMQRECSSWWPWNRCKEYRNRLDESRNHLAKVQKCNEFFEQKFKSEHDFQMYKKLSKHQ